MLMGLLFGSLFFLLFLGIPIGTCLGISAAITMYFTGNLQYLNSVVTRLFTQVDNFVLMISRGSASFAAVSSGES